VLQLAGWLAVELLALKRAIFFLSGQAVGCTLGRARGVAASWLSFCPAEQRAVDKPRRRQQLASDDNAGDL
jgi:hypothetical protein